MPAGVAGGTTAADVVTLEGSREVEAAVDADVCPLPDAEVDSDCELASVVRVAAEDEADTFATAAEEASETPEL